MAREKRTTEEIVRDLTDMIYMDEDAAQMVRLTSNVVSQLLKQRGINAIEREFLTELPDKLDSMSSWREERAERSRTRRKELGY